MRYATKYNAADAFAGRVEYKYCLSCDGALSERIEYNSSWGVVSHRRYEYDGLNLVRVDEKYGSGQWRTLEAATHKPGALGALLHKRVYTHTNADATPEASADFTYAHDAVGNLYCAWDGDGNEVFYFAQDAFGNELPVDLLGQDSWSTARAAGITEHQTGKWLDPFTGLYYFQARYYDPVVGRFVGRDPVKDLHQSPYILPSNNPISKPDPSGKCHGCGASVNRLNGTANSRDDYEGGGVVRPKVQNCCPDRRQKINQAYNRIIQRIDNGCLSEVFTRDFCNRYPSLCVEFSEDYLKQSISDFSRNGTIYCGGAWCAWPRAWGYTIPSSNEIHICDKCFDESIPPAHRIPVISVLGEELFNEAGISDSFVDLFKVACAY